MTHPYIKSITFTPAASSRPIRSPIAQITGKATVSAYEAQGRSAKAQGYNLEDCPYFDTSTAGAAWARGWRTT